MMESELGFETFSKKENKEKNEFLLIAIVNKLASLGIIVADFLGDLSSIAASFLNQKAISVSNTNFSIRFKSRNFHPDSCSEEIVFEDQYGTEHIIIIHSDIQLSRLELKEWYNFGKLPRSYTCEILIFGRRVRIKTEKDVANELKVIQIGENDPETLQKALVLLEATEALFKNALMDWKVYDNKPQNTFSVDEAINIYPKGDITIHSKTDSLLFEYRWEVGYEETQINKINGRSNLNLQEVGTFEIFTDKPDELKKGNGTLFVYFQGIEVKYGKDDKIGNSPISWYEEILFSGERDHLKSRKLPIEHSAKKLGFDHFMTFIFPENLTAKGFKVSMDNFLRYLKDRNFMSSIISFSNGATLMSEWLLDSIYLGCFSDLETLTDKVEEIICAGGLYQPSDLEEKAYQTGKVLLKPLISRIAMMSPIGLHPFIKKGGGTRELINRVRYLYSLENPSKVQEVSSDYWLNAQRIFKNNPSFQIIFLADVGQRIVKQSGAIRWFNLLKPHFPNSIKGFVANDIDSYWIKIPKAIHTEVKNLWTLTSLIGLSQKMRNALRFSPMALQISNEWPKRRFTLM